MENEDYAEKAHEAYKEGKIDESIYYLEKANLTTTAADKAYHYGLLGKAFKHYLSIPKNARQEKSDKKIQNIIKTLTKFETQKEIPSKGIIERIERTPHRYIFQAQKDLLNPPTKMTHEIYNKIVKLN